MIQSPASLIVFLLICVATAAFGGLFEPGVWYETLRKPDWTPPDWVFAPVWSLLYLSVAIAGYLIWIAGGWSGALLVWCLQLALNGIWSWVFFGLHRPGWALAEIAALWLAIGATVSLAWSLRRLAVLIMLPYWAWVSYAAALNLAIWRLNA